MTQSWLLNPYTHGIWGLPSYSLYRIVDTHIRCTIEHQQTITGLNHSVDKPNTSTLQYSVYLLQLHLYVMAIRLS